MFTLVGIEQNVITVNVDNARVITQEIQIQNNVDVTMVTISIDLSNNMIIDITNSVTMNITTAMNININSGDNIINITNNSVDIDINTGDTTVNVTNNVINTVTTNTTISNTETTNIITDNSSNSYTWIFQQDGNLRLPDGGSIIDFAGNNFGVTVSQVLSEIEIVQYPPAGTGALVYEPTTGTLEYTPPSISGTTNGAITVEAGADAGHLYIR